MSEEYTMPEESSSNEEKRKETINQLFCGVMIEEDASRLYAQGVKNIENGLMGISDTHLAKFFEKFAQEDIPESGDTEDNPLVSENHFALYNAYRMLRAEGFAHDEIAGLCGSIANGQLETMLAEKIVGERACADKFIETHKEKLTRADETLAGFATQVRGQDAAYQKPQTLFTGKYQNLVIFSENEITPNDRSEYSTGENVVLVNIKDLISQQEFDTARVSQVMHTYVHEHVHSIGVNEIDKGTEYLPLDPTSAETLRSGFSHKSGKDKKYQLYNTNEATTEYFARQLSNEAGFEGYQGAYQPQVECLEKLFAYLEESNAVGVGERERILKERYGNPDGIVSLRAELEHEIGPNALEICDTLFDIPEEFEQFLISVRKMKNGEQVGNELWVSAQRFTSQFPQLPLLEVSRDYPFLRFSQRAYDEMAQKIIWKEIELA